MRIIYGFKSICTLFSHLLKTKIKTKPEAQLFSIRTFLYFPYYQKLWIDAAFKSLSSLAGFRPVSPMYYWFCCPNTKVHCLYGSICGPSGAMGVLHREMPTFIVRRQSSFFNVKVGGHLVREVHKMADSTVSSQIAVSLSRWPKSPQVGKQLWVTPPMRSEGS